jgi:hypothetical protein
MDDQLRAELLARAAEDQRIRNAATSATRPPDMRIPDDIAAEWERIDEANTRWLDELADSRGWPGRALAGEDGAHAAWLLAQHADRRPELQRKFLDMLRAAVAAGDAEPRNLAYLEDRVRVSDGRPQLYGTQFTRTGTDFGPAPIEAPEHLDARRAAIGLPPFAEYESEMRRDYGRT